MSMKKYEKEIKKHLKERGWDNLRPANLAKSISIEAGELLELFQWTNQSLKDVKKDKAKVEIIKKYPAHLFKNRKKHVDAGSEEIYWKIKKEHRMKGE